MRTFSTAADDKVTFKIIDEQDVEYTVEAEIGQNMMEAGIFAHVPFQVVCGGNAECNTCHCFLNKEVI